MKLILIQPNFIPNLFILNFQLNNSELGKAQPRLVSMIMKLDSAALHSAQPKVTCDLQAEKYLVPRLYYFHPSGVGEGQARVR